MKKLSDDQVEELLRELPKLKDHRDPHVIYDNISKELEKKPSRKTWVIPSFATAAAVCIVAILSFNFLNGVNTNHSADESVRQEEKQDITLKREEITTEESASDEVENIEKATEINDIAFQVTEEPTTAVYPEDVGSFQVFTLAVPDAQGQNVIPVSFLVNSVETTDKLAQLKEIMNSMNEEELGLHEYYPLKAELSLDELGNTLKVDVTPDHPYQYGSASELIFTDAIQQLLDTLQLSQATFTTAQEQGITLGNDIKTTETNHESVNHSYYFYYPNEETRKPYLVESTDSYNTIEEALNAMETDIDTHNLKAPLLVDQINSVDTDEANKLVSISFANEIAMEDIPETVQSIEAILLTAKSFKYERVKFENTPLESVGRFNLLDEIEVPIAANKKIIE